MALLRKSKGTDKEAIGASELDVSVAVEAVVKDQRQSEQDRQLKDLHKLYKDAIQVYHGQMQSRHYIYLERKWGITKETVDQYLLGYAPVKGKFIGDELMKHGYTREQIYRSGLLYRDTFDYFQGRLILPYWNDHGVCFIAGKQTEETLHNEWEKDKYKVLPLSSKEWEFLNSAVTDEYILGEDEGSGSELLIVRYYFDFLSVKQAGFSAVSTARNVFREDDAAKISKVAANFDKVYIISGGSLHQGALSETDLARMYARYLHKKGIQVRVVLLPLEDNTETSLSTYMLKHSADELRTLMVESSWSYDEIHQDNMVFLFNDFSRLLSSVNFHPISTGLPCLDKYLGGGLLPAFYLIGGKSGIGKTAFALQIAHAAAESGADVYYFSLYESRVYLIARYISRLSYLSEGKSFSLQDIIAADDYDELSQLLADNKNASCNMCLVETDISKVDEMIKSRMNRHEEYSNAHALIMVDQFMINPQSAIQSMDELSIFSELRQIIRHYSVPVVGLCEHEDGEESWYSVHAAAMFSDVILTLEDVQDAVSTDDASYDRKIVCSKNRFGASPFEIMLRFYADYSHFSDMHN